MDTDTADELPPPFLYKKEKFLVPEDDPWQNDCLDRETHAKKLWTILDPVRQPFVMTLSAPFGMGKTTFLDCWKQDLSNQGVSTVMFNAWETDFSQDAFAAFIASIHKQLSISKTAKKKFLSGAKRVGGAIIKSAPSFIAKVVAKAAIGESGVKALENFELKEKDAVSLAESIAEDTFKAQVATQNAVEDFRAVFTEIVEQDCNGRLIVFIDELDRCRPNYAVEVLERIKHIFSVKGVIFVLAVDRAQLLNSISGVYGTKLDAQKYFRKFVDWEYNLPKPSLYRYINHLYSNVFALSKKNIFNNGDDLKFGNITFLRLLTLMAYAYRASLRDLDQYFTYLNLIWHSKPTNCYPVELSLAAFLKNVENTEYDSIINWVPAGKYSPSPIQSKLDVMLGSDEIWEQISGSKPREIGWLILLFSRQAQSAENVKVCVDDNFLLDWLPENSSTNNKWIEQCLVMKTSIGRPPSSIQNGLKALNRLNI